MYATCILAFIQIVLWKTSNGSLRFITKERIEFVCQQSETSTKYVQHTEAVILQSLLVNYIYREAFVSQLIVVV